jgi:hypothetical protein
MTENIKEMTPEDRLEQVWTALINPKRTIRSIQILALTSLSSMKPSASDMALAPEKSARRPRSG